MEETKEPQKQNDEDGMSPKQWVQENLRIIISIVIVVALAGGIYSYSQRTQQSQKIADEETEEMMSDKQVMEEGESEKTTTDGVVESGEQKGAEQKDSVTSPAPSQETAQSFVETATRGDGMTHLARRALADYLEKNPDSALTAEHKIYIEDYLRKNASGSQQRVYVGTTVEFSKDLIRTAIERSKQLNDAQIKNLHKYAVQVPSLS